jgi:hypothetical protein
VPRTRKTTGTKTQQINEADLEYLAGVFDMTWGLGGTNTNRAVVIVSKKQGGEFTDGLAAKYGGKSEVMITGGDKSFWTWMLPLDRRLELFDLLNAADKIRSMDVYQKDGYRLKLERAISNKREAESA